MASLRPNFWENSVIAMRTDSTDPVTTRSQSHRESAEDQITVEFLGVPRLRAGIDSCRMKCGKIRDVLSQVQACFPGLTDLLTESGQLAPWYRLAVEGVKFVDDLDLLLGAGQKLLIVSADVGG